MSQPADSTNNESTKAENKEETKKTSSVTSFEKRQPAEGFLLAKVYTPFHTFFEGDAKSITATNESGVFDVLPGHHNFITMLTQCDITVNSAEGGEQIIPIIRGLMHIRKDKIIVFLDV